MASVVADKIQIKENPSIGIRICLKESPYLFHFFRKGNEFQSWIKALCDMHINACPPNLNNHEDGAVCFTEIPITQIVKYIDTPSSMFAGYAIGFNRDMMYEHYSARPVIYGTAEDEEELRKTKLHWRYVNLDVHNNDYSWQREWRVEGNCFNFSEIINAEVSSGLSFSRMIVIAPSIQRLKSDGLLLHSLDLDMPPVKYNCISLDKVRNTESDTMLQLCTISFRTVVVK